MAAPHIRRRVDSGNIDKLIQRAVRVMGVACKQPASPTAVKRGGGRRRGRCSICPTAKDRRTDWKCGQCSEWVCKNRCIKTTQITCETARNSHTRDKYHLHLCSKLYLLVLKHFMYFTLYNCMNNEKFNKSNVLTSTESIK